MLINQRAFALILIPIIIVLVIGAGAGSYFLAKTLKPQPSTSPIPSTSLVAAISKASPTSSPTAEPESDLFKKGLYINPGLNAIFDYPADWVLDSRYLEPNKNSEISFSITRSKSEEDEDGDFFVAQIYKGQDPNLMKIIETALANPSSGITKTKMGRTDGFIYTQQVGTGYKEIFVSVFQNISFLFYIQADSNDREKYNGLLGQIVSSVRGYDKSGLKFPDYQDDNIVIDSKIAPPSYVPEGFSEIYAKRTAIDNLWSYSIDVTENSSGPNDLNIWEKPKGVEYVLYKPNTVSLDNELNYEIKTFVGDEGLNSKEEVSVKGYKGYYIGRKYKEGYSGTPSKSGLSDGYLVFETDKSVVLIMGYEHVDPTKTELLKIAESMVH